MTFSPTAFDTWLSTDRSREHTAVCSECDRAADVDDAGHCRTCAEDIAAEIDTASDTTFPADAHVDLHQHADALRAAVIADLDTVANDVEPHRPPPVAATLRPARRTVLVGLGGFFSRTG